MPSAPPPRRVEAGDREAYLWTLTVHGVKHHLAWWPATGEMLWSYLRTPREWSPFVRLGPRYSPRHDLTSAQAAVTAWAKNMSREMPED